MPNVGMRKGRPGPREAKGRLRVLGINSKGAVADLDNLEAGVSILTYYGENPHYVKLPIFSEFMENSAKFMKNSGLRSPSNSNTRTVQ